MSRFLKKLKFKLQLWDGIWSVPLAAFAFMIVGVLLQWIFGESVGFYDPSFLQAAFLSSFILILFNSIAFFGLYFNFKHLFKYYRRDSRKEFDNLPPWLKISFLLFLYVFYIVVLVILTKTFL